jgi:hypothetical protein
VVCAPSGSGKTNFIYNFIELFCQGKGTFHTIHIVTQIADEPLYRALGGQNITITEGIRTLPKLDEYDKNFNHLVILDDLQMEKDQSRIIQYYIRCRKLNVSVMYLAQNYFSIPIEIRNNANYFIILKISSKRDFTLMVKDFGVWTIPKELLMAMFEYATAEHMVPFIVNKEESDPTKKFRKGFLQYLNPADFIETGEEELSG